MARFRAHGTFGMEPVPLTGAPGEAGRPGGLGAAAARGAGAGGASLRGLAGRRAGAAPRAARTRAPGARGAAAARACCPLRSSLGEFMGWPAVLVGGETGAVRRGPGQRLGDIGTAVAIGLLWFAAVASGRAGARAPRPRGHRRGAPARRRRAAVGAAPAGGRAALGRSRPGAARLVPVASRPWPRGGWPSPGSARSPRRSGPPLDAAYRERPPEAPVGLVGPWNGGSCDLAGLAAWNRDYPENWSAAGDLRIFWRALLGRNRSSGGKR